MLLGLLLTVATAVAQPAATTTEAFRFDYLRVRDRIEADGQGQRVIEVSVLLRTPAAVQQFGQIGGPYVDGYGSLTFENVRVQKPGGSATEVKDGQIEDLNPFGINDASIPVDIRYKKLTIARLEPGDRLSYALVTTTKPFVPGESYGEMKFTPVPVDGPQVYELDIPARSRLSVTLRADLGVTWEALPSPADRLVRRLTVTVPPTVVASTGLTEAQTNSLQTPDVSFTTFPSWSSVASWWWNMSRGQVRGDEATKRETERVVAGRKTPREKIEAIASFVSTRVRYLNVGFGIGRMRPRPAASVLSSRYGDCKDKVGLVMAMAAEAGIEVRPVLIHSQRNDLQDEAPGPHQFDHMIAAAVLGPEEKDWLWIDPTNSLASPLTLLPTTRDKRALVIEPTGRGVVVRTPAAPPHPSRQTVTLTGTLETSGVLKGKLRVEERSDNEPAMRAAFASVSPEQHAELLKASYARLWKDARIKAVRTADPVDIAAPFWLEFEFERDVSGMDSEKEWKLWIPDLGPVLVEASTDATAKKVVLFDVGEVTFNAIVELPENVTARAPLSITLDRPFASLSSRYSVTGRTLAVSRSLKLPTPFLDRTQVPAYEALRKAADTDREQDFMIGPVRSAAPAAATLHKEGKAAWNTKDFPRALDLLQKAVAADPKLKNIHEDLGLAHRELKDYEKAVAAFTKAIEADPYGETAHAERAYALFELNRDEEAEKDLLKQIEVAPFKAWSYRRLAQLRRSQRRYKEAAELFTKSLAIDPSPVGDWMDLGKAHAIEGQVTEARAAFAKAEQIGLETGRRTFVARGYALIGDMKAAEDLARKDLPELLEKVKAITNNDFVGEMYWTDRMVEAWGVIGSAALAKGDLDTAERFLKASWDGGMSPDDGLPFAITLTRRGKKAEAAAILSAVITMRPSMFGRPEMPGLFKDLGSFAVNAKSDIASRLAGAIPIVAEKLPSRLTENVTILVQEGRVAAAREFSKRREAELTPLIEALVGQKAPWFDPDGKGVTIVRDGFIGCGTIGCHWFARIESPPRATTEAVDVGSIAITRITPSKETLLLAGSTVAMKVSLDYDLEGTKDGQVGVFALDDRSRQLLKLPLAKVVKPGKGTVEFAFDFAVPKDATSVRVNAILFVSAPSKTNTEVVFKVRK